MPWRRHRMPATGPGARNNLRNIGLALFDYQTSRGGFPRGTIPATGLPPEKRLGLFVIIWSFFDLQGIGILWEKDLPWDSRQNLLPPVQVSPTDGPSWVQPSTTPPAFPARCLTCPTNPSRTGPGLPPARCIMLELRDSVRTLRSCPRPIPGPGSSGTIGRPASRTSRTCLRDDARRRDRAPERSLDRGRTRVRTRARLATTALHRPGTPVRRYPSGRLERRVCGRLGPVHHRDSPSQAVRRSRNHRGR